MTDKIDANAAVDYATEDIIHCAHTAAQGFKEAAEKRRNTAHHHLAVVESLREITEIWGSLPSTPLPGGLDRAIEEARKLIPEPEAKPEPLDIREDRTIEQLRQDGDL